MEKRRRACCIGLAVQAGVHNPHGSGHKSDNCRLQKAGMAFKREKQQLRRAPRKAAEKNKARQLRKKGHAVYCDKQILKELLEEKR